MHQLDARMNIKPCFGALIWTFFPVYHYRTVKCFLTSISLGHFFTVGLTVFPYGGRIYSQIVATLILVFHSVLAMDFFLGKDFGFFTGPGIISCYYIGLSYQILWIFLSSLRSHVCLVLCKAMELCVGNYKI